MIRSQQWLMLEGIPQIGWLGAREARTAVEADLNEDRSRPSNNASVFVRWLLGVFIHRSVHVKYSGVVIGGRLHILDGNQRVQTEDF